jgi:dephospho-CoA kinase
MTMPPPQPAPEVDADRMVRLTAEAGALGYAEVVAQLGRVLAVNEAQARVIGQLRGDLRAEAAERERLAQALEEVQGRLNALEQDDGEDSGRETSP